MRKATNDTQEEELNAIIIGARLHRERVTHNGKHLECTVRRLWLSNFGKSDE